MTDTARRLADLDRTEFDPAPWEEAPAAVPEVSIHPDDMAFLRSKVFDEPWTDPARFPECMGIAWAALERIACNEYVDEAPGEAQIALRLMARRADFGGPLDEMEGS